IDECQSARCHQEAVCYNTQGSFTCQCRPGYYGDGFYCSSEHKKTKCETHRDRLLGSAEFGRQGPQPVPGQYVPTCDSQGAYEATQCHGSVGQCWCVDRNGLEIPGTRSGTSRPLLTNSLVKAVISVGGRDWICLEKVIIGVAYDCVEKMVYWTDITSPSISKANLQGGETIPVISSDLESPEGITIDHLGRTLFWTDSMKDRIEVSSLDGTQRRVLIDTDLVNPRAIILGLNMYWADWNRDAPKIETAAMDGTNRRVLVKDDLGLPNGLTYDPQSSQLCWADAGTGLLQMRMTGEKLCHFLSS
ncbi:unnamed protein product, partial [Coregonus sp. 'balchen']